LELSARELTFRLK